ncbi:MAG TPA: LarC family nickel insertion protein, partial [Candidatus Dormibacteraeota bacterium]
MATVHLDCINGAAGDMLLAALVDAGASTAAVERALAACGVEARLTTTEVRRAGLRGLQLGIHPAAGELGHERDLAACLAAVEGSDLPPRLQGRAAAALQALGEAEAKLHGVALADVHLHELGALDTLVDIVGVAAALEDLDVTALTCGPLPAGSGTVTAEHGELPLPAPATLQILAAAHFALVGGQDGVEQVTPTGAAILAAMARQGPPRLQLLRVGHGAGTRDDSRRPNLVRCWLGEALPAVAGDDGAGSRSAFDDPAVELRVNLDDATPAAVAELAVRCLEAGALDAWVVPATMKKGRPGHILHVLAAEGADVALATLLLDLGPTLGVRRSWSPRLVA